VEENKRQLCVFKIATDKKQPWLWWDYAAGFAEECTMQNGRFADRSPATTIAAVYRAKSCSFGGINLINISFCVPRKYRGCDVM